MSMMVTSVITMVFMTRVSITVDSSGHSEKMVVTIIHSVNAIRVTTIGVIGSFLSSLVSTRLISVTPASTAAKGKEYAKP
jgi:hypothetical protein